MARTDAKELLFFPRTPAGKAAAKAYLARVRERVMDRDAPITLSSFHRQITTIRGWGRAEPVCSPCSSDCSWSSSAENRALVQVVAPLRTVSGLSSFASDRCGFLLSVTTAAQYPIWRHVRCPARYPSLWARFAILPFRPRTPVL